MDVLGVGCRGKYFILQLVLLQLVLLQSLRVVNAGKQPYYHKGTDKLYYKFHDEQASRSEAEKRCRGEGAELVVIRSHSTLAYVQDTFRYVTNGIWSGASWVVTTQQQGNTTTTTGRWEWDDGTMVSNESWAGGRGVPFRNESDPESLTKNCAMINFGDAVGGHLHDVDCKWEVPRFLCQKAHRSCVYETGACVTSQKNVTVNSTVLLPDVTDVTECLEACLLQGANVTGCWVVESAGSSTSPCRVTFDDAVKKGGGGQLGTCWIIDKCEGTGPLPPPLPEPPSNYTQHTDDEFTHFKLYKYEASYYQAKLKCHEDGAQLFIDTSKIHQFILDTYPGLVFWIGVNDLEQKGIWRYEDSTRLVKKTFWDYGSRTHRCALMWHNGRWRDENCNKKKYFLCQKEGMYVVDAFKGNSNNILLPIVIVGVIAALVIIGGVVYAQFRSRRSGGNNADGEDPSGVPNSGGGDGGPIDPLKPGNLSGGQQQQQPQQGGDDSASYHNEGADHEEVRGEPIVMYRPTADEATVEEGGTRKKKKNKNRDP